MTRRFLWTRKGNDPGIATGLLSDRAEDVEADLVFRLAHR
jgi:hypothetical protein